MGLRDFIKKNDGTELEDKDVIEAFEKNVALYKGHSDNWNIRITADELGIPKDVLCAILEEHYDQ